jgi:hypothetical protein
MAARKQRPRSAASASALLPSDNDVFGAAGRAVRHRTAAGLALVDSLDAAAHLERMGLLLQSPHPYLPSLFGAAQGKPAKAGAAGFGQWPEHAWSWAGELAERDDVLLTKVLLGKRTLVHRRLWPALDAAVRGRAPEGADELALMRVLDRHDGVRTDELRTLAGLGGAAARQRYERAITRLEAHGLVLCRPVLVERHRHVGVARSWTARFPSTLGGGTGIAPFVFAVIGAAGTVPVSEPGRWFRWPRAEVESAIRDLLESGRLRTVQATLQPVLAADQTPGSPPA